MDNILLHEYQIKLEGVKKKTIYHFSDTHLTEYDTLSTEAETEQAKKATENWIRVREYFATHHKEPYGEAQQINAKEHFLNLVNVSRDGDALVIAGDMLDYVSPANVRLADEALRGHPCPVVALCGNHENPSSIPDGTAISKMKEPVQVVEWDDLIILGIDDSKREITEKQYDALVTALESKKKVIVAMHIPIMVEGNENVLKGAGEYFRLNYKDCPELNHKFIELIRSSADKIAAVLCGHLHFANNTPLSDGLVQYVSTQGITGNINKYIIGE